MLMLHLSAEKIKLINALNIKLALFVVNFYRTAAPWLVDASNLPAIATYKIKSHRN